MQKLGLSSRLLELGVKRKPGELEHQPVADADLSCKIHLQCVILDAAVERIQTRYAAKCAAAYRHVLHRLKKTF